MQPTEFSLDNLEQFIGRELGVSDWVLIDQERIDRFADATGDHQWIHVDPERARLSPLGSTIAHGYLTLALMPGLTEQIGVIPAGVQHVLNYGADRLRFPNFVKVNSRVRARVRLIGVERKPGRTLIKLEQTAEIAGETKPAMVAETLMLLLA